MSFQKAKDLLKLANMSASRHRGISVQEIAEEFAVNERTAQRMIQALKDVFPTVSHVTDSDRRRRWKVRETSKLGMPGLYDHELVALEMSIRRAEREGAQSEKDALCGLRDRLMATLPPIHARRAEVDAETLLEARGYACRPGPRVKTPEGMLKSIAGAMRGPYRLTLMYQGEHDPEPKHRVIEPYGLLFGTRHYLIGRDIAKDDRFRRFRLDRMSDVEITIQWFEKDKDFDLQAYAEQSFGSFHSDAEFTRIVWRFSAAAAVAAREFEFHPKQEFIDQDDGSLLVIFDASGLVEMAWHLAKWGDAVEVIEPAALRDMVSVYRTSPIKVRP